MKLATTCLAVCLMFGTAMSTATAADFPTKPIRIVVPYPPGGSTDAVARMVGQKLSAQFKQPVIVDNRPGASEAIAAANVATSPADGHHLLFATMTGLSVNTSLYSNLAYNPQKDFVPVIQATTIPSVVVVNPKVPVNWMAELPKFIKNNPNGANYASAGAGTPSHLGMELYNRSSGVKAIHVPYKGGAPALQDLMAGQISIMMALMPEAMPLVKAGKLKALAVTTTKRTAEYPELPTVAESGMPGFEMIFWQALVAPAGTPKEVVVKINHAFNEILQDKEIKAKLTEMGLGIAGGSPEQLASLMKDETVKWKKVVDDAGIKLD